MIWDKNKRIKQLEQALRELTADNKLFLKTHISNRDRLRVLIAQAEKALGGDDDGNNRRYR